jgi:glycosyltransferase involved in cell wall biosynthesis
VLTSDIPENREVVDDAGFTFRPGDVRDLERMLRLLPTDPQVREAAGRRGQEKVWRSYLWPRITADIERTYLRLTGRKHITEVLPTPEGCTNSEPKQRDRAV